MFMVEEKEAKRWSDIGCRRMEARGAKSHVRSSFPRKKMPVFIQNLDAVRSRQMAFPVAVELQARLPTDRIENGKETRSKACPVYRAGLSTVYFLERF